jgi:hypothetical protein
MTKKKDVNLQDLTDEEVGLNYLEDKATEKECEGRIALAREELLMRLDSRGVASGIHSIIAAGAVQLKKEVRQSLVVKNEAVTLLESKQMEDCIDSVATIKMRDGIDPKKIPAKLLQDMEKYFDITLNKSVSKDMLTTLVGSGRLTEKERDKVVVTKETFALKVKKI